MDPYESLDDALFTTDAGDDTSARAMRQPLMLHGCTEPDTVLEQFSRNFAQRYGPMHPLFYVGSLSAAVREATSGSAMGGTVSHFCEVLLGTVHCIPMSMVHVHCMYCNSY